MGGVQSEVKAVFIGKTLIAVLEPKVEPIAWLTRNGFVLMGDPRFDPKRVKVPVRAMNGGVVAEAVVHTMPLER